MQTISSSFSVAPDRLLSGNQADWIDATLRLSPEAFRCFTDSDTTTSTLDSLNVQVWDEAIISVFEEMRLFY